MWEGVESASAILGGRWAGSGPGARRPWLTGSLASSSLARVVPAGATPW